MKKPSKYLIKALRESEEERKMGRFKSFKTADQVLAFIDKTRGKDNLGLILTFGWEMQFSYHPNYQIQKMNVIWERGTT